MISKKSIICVEFKCSSCVILIKNLS